MKYFVRLILLNSDNQVLVMKENRNSKIYDWNYPGGKVEKGEDILEAITRETYEEIGIKIKEPKLFYVGEYIFSNDKWKGLFFIVKHYEGKISIKEPEKCSHMEFKSCIELSDKKKFSRVVSDIGSRLTKKFLRSKYAN